MVKKEYVTVEDTVKLSDGPVKVKIRKLTAKARREIVGKASKTKVVAGRTLIDVNISEYNARLLAWSVVEPTDLANMEAQEFLLAGDEDILLNKVREVNGDSFLVSGTTITSEAVEAEVDK